MDKLATIHVGVGKLSFDIAKIDENIKDFIATVISSNVEVSKINAIKSIYISKTMGPGLRLEVSEFKK